MTDGLKMVLAMVLLFGAVYLYSFVPDVIQKYKAKKRKRNQIKKEKYREKEKLQLQIKRDEKTKAINERRDQIKQHFIWLEEMNKKINKNTKTKTQDKHPAESHDL